MIERQKKTCGGCWGQLTTISPAFRTASITQNPLGSALNRYRARTPCVGDQGTVYHGWLVTDISLVLRMASRHPLNCCPGPTDTPSLPLSHLQNYPVTPILPPPTAPTSGLMGSDNGRRLPASIPNRWLVPSAPHPLPPQNLPLSKTLDIRVQPNPQKPRNSLGSNGIPHPAR